MTTPRDDLLDAIAKAFAEPGNPPGYLDRHAASSAVAAIAAHLESVGATHMAADGTPVKAEYDFGGSPSPDGYYRLVPVDGAR